MTAKDNNLLEVWKYPFQENELPKITFPSTVNGVVVDQEVDRLYVTESGKRRVNVFSLPNLSKIKVFGEGEIGKGKTNIDLLKHNNGETWIYVTSSQKVYAFRSNDKSLATQFRPDVGGMETVLADDFYQIIYVPDESGTFIDRLGSKLLGKSMDKGIHAFSPNGTPYLKKGTNILGREHFQADAEGILLYVCQDEEMQDQGHGFIIVSDQRRFQTEFEIFDRKTWRHLGVFSITGISNTDGITSTQKALPDYPMGLFLAVNDDTSTVGVGWEKIIEATGLNCDTLSTKSEKCPKCWRETRKSLAYWSTKVRIKFP